MKEQLEKLMAQNKTYAQESEENREKNQKIT